MPSNATGWLNKRFGGAGAGGVIGAFTTQQQLMQTHFDAQLGTIANAVTRRVVKKGIYRVGKLMWAASSPVHANGARFAGWSKTSRSTGSEQNLQMNCWEGVLYLAYQCDAMTKAKCVNFYQSPVAADTKLRSLFGTAAVYNPPAAVPNPGDLLTFEDHANNLVNHVAIYVGIYLGAHYALHNLSYNGVTTGLQMGGGFHFEDMASLIGRYGGVTVRYTQPFWEAGSPTNAYYAAL
ncbi:MAG: hypothetical protein ACFCVH_10100 [Alphaproteobacteria bacterium]